MASKYQKVLVIGASSGIGRDVALEYARRGSEVILASRNEQKLSEITRIINTSGGNAEYFIADVTNIEQINELAEYIRKSKQGIDLAIFNSGISLSEKEVYENLESFEKIYDVNVFGLLRCFEAITPILKDQGGGTIAAVSSLADGRGFPGSVAYCSSKAAATQIIEAARIELKKYKINVMMIKPGFVRTELLKDTKTSTPFIMESEEAAKIIVKGIEKNRKIIAFPWITAVSSYLGRLLPTSWFEMLVRKIGRIT